MLSVFRRLTPRRCVLERSVSVKRILPNIIPKQGASISSSTDKTAFVLGIETSCDDTGAAVVDNLGNVRGESLNSQQQIHTDHGGIIPPIARDLHSLHIKRVVDEALEKAELTIQQVDAVAVTVKPGLSLSLIVGMEYGKQLCRESGKPFIPIHHMEAHALTIRMVEQVEFPFLVLLISGGHCLLAVADKVDHFLLLGQSIDDAPGEAFDKTARRLKLPHLQECSGMSGGRAIEFLAERGDPSAFTAFPSPLSRYRDCNFSFSGLKQAVLRIIQKLERENDIEGGDIIPHIEDVCASFQHYVARHLCHRVQRAMVYVEQKNLIPDNQRTLVISGGAACNNYIRKSVGVICDAMGYKLLCPPPKLCTDNGVMIAWNGMERWKAGVGASHDLDSIDIQAKCPLGENLIEDVTSANIKCTWIRLTELRRNHVLHHNQNLAQ